MVQRLSPDADAKTTLGLLGSVLLSFVTLTGLLFSQSRESPPSPDPTEPARLRMVRVHLKGRGIKDPRVLKAMGEIPRHLFVPADQRDRAYEDCALPIGMGQTISAPSVVAYMTEQIRPQPTDRVLEIGTGSGYQAAVVSRLVKEVYTIEILEPLAKKAEETLKQLGYHNVWVRVGDGFLGWTEKAPFDAIIVTCSAPRIPEPLFEQLKEAGRMIIPLGSKYLQRLYLIEKRKGKPIRKPLLPTQFVPMVGKIREAEGG